MTLYTSAETAVPFIPWQIPGTVKGGGEGEEK